MLKRHEYYKWNKFFTSFLSGPEMLEVTDSLMAFFLAFHESAQFDFRITRPNPISFDLKVNCVLAFAHYAIRIPKRGASNMFV